MTKKKSPKPVHHALRGRYAGTALVLQGGGALGAYQAGVYEALAEAGCEPDWLAGISIGAINCAIIAGNPPERRVERLHQFWDQVTSAFPWPAPDFGDEARRWFNGASAFASLSGGQPGFFTLRFPPASMLPHGAAGANSVYDTAPLRQTLESLVDFDRLNTGATRVSVGAVNVRTGNFAYFDTSAGRIGPEHIMASGALPPGLPPIEIAGEHYWDGGLVSNTPLSQVLEGTLAHDTLVFQVDLFSSRGELPGDLMEAEERRKHITYSSRTRLNTDLFSQRHALRRAIVELFERLPPDARQDEAVRRLRDLGDDRAVGIVQLIYRRRDYEGNAIDYEFSRASMEEHWKAGLDDARRTLAARPWLEEWDGADGVRVYDVLKNF